jgi:photosystem II stability/assembly factor-like uncharacterized protein
VTLDFDPFDPDVIYAGSNRAGVFKSEDQGETWVQASIGMDPNERILDLEPDTNRPGVYYAATYHSGVYVTRDGGERWENISGDTFYHSRAQVLALSRDGDVLYVGSMINGVYRLGTPQISDAQQEAQDGAAGDSRNQVVLIGAAVVLVLIGLGAVLALKRAKGIGA